MVKILKTPEDYIVQLFKEIKNSNGKLTLAIDILEYKLKSHGYIIPEKWNHERK